MSSHSTYFAPNLDMFPDKEGNPSLDYLRMQAKNDVARQAQAGISLSRLWLDAHAAAGSGKLSKHELAYFTEARREISSKMSAKIAEEAMRPLRMRATTPKSPTTPVVPREAVLDHPGTRDAAAATGMHPALAPTPSTDPRMTEFHRRCQRQSVRAGLDGRHGQQELTKAA